MSFNPFIRQVTVLLLAGSCLVRDGASNTQGADPGTDLHASWLLALSDEDWQVRRRAVQEITASGDKNESVAEALLALANRSNEALDGEVYDLVVALRDVVSPEQCERQLANGGSERCSAILCLAVGLMGERAKAYVRTVQGTLSNQTIRANIKLTAAIGLANVGFFDKPDIGAISSALQDGDEMKSTALWAMMFGNRDEWITQEVMLELCAVLDEGSPYHSGLAAVILSRLESRSKAAREALEGALERVRTNPRQGEGSRLLYEFSATRPVEGWSSSSSLREPVRLLGKSSVGFDLPVQANILLITHFLVQTNEIRNIIGLLRHREPEIVMGAVKLCWGIGVPARDAENDLLAVLENGHAEELRFIASLALGAVGGNRCLTELRRLVAKEASPNVRHALESSVKLIKQCPAKW